MRARCEDPNACAWTALVLAVVLIAGGCGGRQPPAEGTVLASVDGETIAAADLTAAILAVPRPDRYDYVSGEARRELLDTLIDRKLMAGAARRLALTSGAAGGANSEPALAQAYLDQQLAAVVPPADAEVAAYYEANAAEFVLPERLQLTRLVFPDETQATAALSAARAGAALEKLGDRAVRPTTLWLQRLPGQQSALAAAAFATPTGALGPVLRLEGGYCIFRVNQRLEATARPLTEVRAGVVARLEAARRDALLNGMRGELRKSARIEVDETALAGFDWSE